MTEEQLLNELEKIQDQIENIRKIENQRKAAGEIKSFQQKAGRLALNYLLNKQGFKEIKGGN